MSEENSCLVRARRIVYLMGGENRGFEIGEFPRLKKRAVFEKGGGYIIDVEATPPFESRSGT